MILNCLLHNRKIDAEEKRYKKPSDYMKNLTNALEDVVKDIDDPSKNEVNMGKLDTLHKAALKYYDKRQGIIFSPFTDEGQSRLQTVSRLVRLTDDIVEQMRKSDEHLQQREIDNLNKNRGLSM